LGNKDRFLDEFSDQRSDVQEIELQIKDKLLMSQLLCVSFWREIIQIKELGKISCGVLVILSVIQLKNAGVSGLLAYDNNLFVCCETN
jgi:hypothetical protein